MKKRYLVLIGLLILVVIGGIAIFWRYKNNDVDEEKIESEKLEEREHKKLDEDVYAFVLFEKGENNYVIMEAHKRGLDRQIFPVGKASGFSIKHNRIYYKVFENGNTKLMYIDLNDDVYEQRELISISKKDNYSENVGYYFDLNDDYIFTSMGATGIYRYDLETGELMVFNSEKAFYLFVYKDKVYFYNYADDDSMKYCMMDFNGENIEIISEKEYEDALLAIDAKKETYNYNEQYFIKNNKKISLSENCKSLLIDGEVAYETKNNHVMMLEYISYYEDKIGILEYEFKEYSMENEEKLIFDIEKKEMVSFNDDFRNWQIIYM